MNLQQDIDTIWIKDEQMQMECMEDLTVIRKVFDDQMVQQDIAFWRSLGLFYVPSDQYMKDKLGSHITQFQYGLYRAGYCSLYDRVAIPLRSLTGDVLGFAGYLCSEPSGDTSDYMSSVKYLFPPEHVLDKSRYVYCEPDWFKGALSDEYICIVDGLFDAIRLNQNGIHAVSLCGSRLTEWHKMYLSFIKRKIVIADNDSAGVRLAEQCLRSMTGVSWMRFSGFKDIDDWMKSKDRADKVSLAVRNICDTGSVRYNLCVGNSRARKTFDEFEREKFAEPVDGSALKRIIVQGFNTGEVISVGQG